jgi:tetratricopeptide (TPR) repeat protein
LNSEPAPASNSRLRQKRLLWLIPLVALLPILYFILRPDNKPSDASKNDVPAAGGAPLLSDELVYLLAAVERDGWTDEYRRDYIQLMQAQGNLEAVGVLLSAQMDLTIEDLPTLQLLVTEALNRGDWAGAIANLNQILQISPDDAQANYQVALLLASENPQIALTHLAKAIENPDFEANSRSIQSVLLQLEATPTPEDLRTLGLVCMDLSEWACAERAFSAAIALDNLDWQSYTYRGFVRDEVGGTGLNDLETAVALNPSGLTYYFLGLHYRNIEENLQTALDTLATAYSLDPSNPALAAELASAEQASSDFEAAQNWYNLAVSLAPEDLRWQRLRAAFYADTNFLIDEVGLAAIQEAFALSSRDADILTSMGAAYYWLFNREEARNYLQQAVGLEPNNPRARYYFGLQLAREGDTQGAMDSLQFVVQNLGPENGFGLLAARELQRLGQPVS